jgi:hypothetical protein
LPLRCVLVGWRDPFCQGATNGGRDSDCGLAGPAKLPAKASRHKDDGASSRHALLYEPWDDGLVALPPGGAVLVVGVGWSMSALPCRLTRSKETETATRLDTHSSRDELPPIDGLHLVDVAASIRKAHVPVATSLIYSRRHCRTREMEKQRGVHFPTAPTACPAAFWRSWRLISGPHPGEASVACERRRAARPPRRLLQARTAPFFESDAQSAGLREEGCRECLCFVFSLLLFPYSWSRPGFSRRRLAHSRRRLLGEAGPHRCDMPSPEPPPQQQQQQQKRRAHARSPAHARPPPPLPASARASAL